MKNKHKRFSLAGLAVMLAAARDLLAEVKGTGQTVADLMRSGWSYVEIHRDFAWDRITIVLLIVAAVWFGISARSGRRGHA